jgi:hypothetical protein
MPNGEREAHHRHVTRLSLIRLSVLARKIQEAFLTLMNVRFLHMNVARYSVLVGDFKLVERSIASNTGNFVFDQAIYLAGFAGYSFISHWYHVITTSTDAAILAFHLISVFHLRPGGWVGVLSPEKQLNVVSSIIANSSFVLGLDNFNLSL